MKRHYLFWVLILCFLLFSCFGPSPNVTDTSMEIIDPTLDPIQINLSNAEPIHLEAKKLDAVLFPKAEYKIRAIVVSKKKYTSGDWTINISNWDLALAWGLLAENDNYKEIDFSQRGRWYYFNVDADDPVSLDEVYKNSANTHIIHATPNIKYAVSKIRKGDIVYLEGYLVYVSGTYKGRDIWWNSSLSRTDRGDGACEILYLQRMIHNGNVYE